LTCVIYSRGYNNLIPQEIKRENTILINTSDKEIRDLRQVINFSVWILCDYDTYEEYCQKENAQKLDKSVSKDYTYYRVIEI